MEKSKEKNLLKNQGITLIALVITVIVLLILAGVTIQTLTGENGLIQKASSAQRETLKAEGLEKIQVEVAGSYNNNGEIDKEQLKINLQNIEGIKTEDDQELEDDIEINLPMLVKLDQNEYIIKTDGNVTVKGNGIDEYDIVKHPEKYYGMYVTNYNSPYDAGILDKEEQLGKWQIFMADEDNIYLISSNCISREYTKEKNEIGYNYNTDLEKDEAYDMWFTDIKEQYSDEKIVSALLSKFDSNTVKKYHKWMNNENNQKKNYAAKKNVASMIDIDLWDGYKNSTYAKYAIGGPTLEMFTNSYNRVHNADIIILDDKGEYGYKIKKYDGNYENTITNLKTNIIADKMYFSNNYWLASPDNYSTVSGAVNVQRAGKLRTYSWYGWTDVGFRPLVCLKNNIHLIENVDENNNVTYELGLD